MATKSAAGKGSGRRTSQVPSAQFMQNWANTFKKNIEPAPAVIEKPPVEVAPKTVSIKQPIALEIGSAYKYIPKVNSNALNAILGRITAIEGDTITFSSPGNFDMSMHRVAAQYSLHSLESHEITQLANFQKIVDDGKDVEHLLSRANMLKKPNYFMYHARKTSQISIIEGVLNQTFNAKILTGECKVIRGKIVHDVGGTIYYVLVRFNRQEGLQRVFSVDADGDITTVSHVIAEKWIALFDRDTVVTDATEIPWTPSTAVVVDILNPTPKKENES